MARENKTAAFTRKRLPDERMAELLDVAAEVFITNGFAAASTNQIAQLANASKTTFYSRFPTKEALFLAVIERRMTLVFEQVANFPEHATIEKTLREFGANLLKIALSPQQIALVRVISMESGKYPELAQQFYEKGPKRGEDSLTAYLSKQIELRRLRAEDPRTMASHLISLLTGSPVRWFVLGIEPQPTGGAALTGHINSVVSLFLRGYGVTP